ncbi:MAG: SPOR domain-containing protein [Gammaproteobacteria bacterium]|nr:SPOR domain-containing protein [Gammaproteobacteria bacterium]
MSDTSTADPQGDESHDPLAELESIVVRSAQRFAPQSTADDAELAYYLGTKPRKPRSGRHPAPARPAAPAPQNKNDPHTKDFRGSSEDQLEAAFRSLEKQASSAPVRQGSVFKNEPVFEEPPPQDYSRTFAQSFEEEMAGSPGTSGQEFETRADAFDFDTRFVTVTAITGLVFVAVIGALMYSCVGVKNTGEPIVIKPDTSAVKNLATAETEQPSSNKRIDDRLGSTDDSNNEKIVSREQQPVDNLQAPDASSAAVPAAPASPPRASSTTPRAILPNPSAPETGTLNAPRQVPTTTIRVRPDGTMENIPSNADRTSATPGLAAKTLTASPAAQAVVPTITTPPAIRQPSPSETNEELAGSPPSAAAAEDVATPAVRTATPPKPVTKPQAQPLRRANVTSTTPSIVPSSGAGFMVQVSSRKTQGSAQASFSSLQARFPQVLMGYQPSIKAVTLGGHGTYYRVRVGPLASRDKASALCGRLKAAGGDCIVVPTGSARNEPTDRGGRLLQRPASPSGARLEESRPRGPR